jgi:hypothetical protein
LADDSSSRPLHDSSCMFKMISVKYQFIADTAVIGRDNSEFIEFVATSAKRSSEDISFS